MKSPEKLHKELTKKLVTENYVDLQPINTIEPTAKEPFWRNFEKFLAEGNSLEPIVNNDMKTNTLEKEKKVKADPKLKYEMDSKLAGSYKVSDGVKNIESHNYDYTAENINNVNAQEVLTGIQCEINYNKELTLDEAKEIAVKNLNKNPLHYVEEGQFGIKGLGYTESKQQQSDGDNYGGSGFSEKLKDGGDSMELVKESKDEDDCGCGDKKQINEQLGGIVTSGNPNSLAAMSGQIIRDMMAEKEEKELPMDEAEDEGTAASYSDTTWYLEEKDKPDFPDIDGDGDTEESMKKASADKKKRVKKESIETKLAEIGKAGEITKMEAQLEYINNHIDEKINRLSSINEDDNLKELIDKKKMKEMQKEIKLLERRKVKMEKVYEKMSGNAYKKIVDENE
tara:strand:+ start:906 stop:2096 length:1191 start_codon:yes stop_codon:yes gene_type:complete